MGIFSALFGADFAPAKCKTSLRLCLGRVKLLKNKKRVALQALRREIAELMGKSVSFSKSQLARAHERLRLAAAGAEVDDGAAGGVER